MVFSFRTWAMAWMVIGVGASAFAAGIADHDTTLPIEIAADRLEVQQENEAATFVGNVEVKQGQLTIHADRLKVLYSLNNDQASSAQSISRIEADGNVSIISPDETASGNQAIYDLPQDKIALKGDVILTQGDNIIRGGGLDIDLQTSIATVTAAGNGGDQRVRALFVPAPK